MWHTKSIQAKALLYTILLSAICHLIITLFIAIFTNSPDKANMFVVLGVNLIWPSLGVGANSAILGALTVATIWLILVAIMRRNQSRVRQGKKKHEAAV